MEVIPVLPSQYLQLFQLNPVHGLSLSPIAVGNALILGLDLRDNAVQV